MTDSTDDAEHRHARSIPAPEAWVEMEVEICDDLTDGFRSAIIRFDRELLQQLLLELEC